MRVSTPLLRDPGIPAFLIRWLVVEAILAATAVTLVSLIVGAVHWWLRSEVHAQLEPRLARLGLSPDLIVRTLDVAAAPFEAASSVTLSFGLVTVAEFALSRVLFLTGQWIVEGAVSAVFRDAEATKVASFVFHQHLRRTVLVQVTLLARQPAFSWWQCCLRGH
jgi:hypothetical protein